MKKTIFSILAAFGINAMVAQTNTATPDYGNNAPLSTPNTITSKFNADYPNNNPTWTSDNGTYRAQYMDGTTNMGRSVIYDKDGTMMSREEQLSNTSYPMPIVDYYSKTYPNEKYDVWSTTDKAGNTTYYTNRNDETIWFDKNGKYKSKTTKSGKAKKSK